MSNAHFSEEHSARNTNGGKNLKEQRAYTLYPLVLEELALNQILRQPWISIQFMYELKSFFKRRSEKVLFLSELFLQYYGFFFSSIIFETSR